MAKLSQYRKLFQRLLLLTLVSVSSQLSWADGIAVTGDSVTISASAGGFNQAKSLVSGTIPNTDNVPTASITSDLTFTFDVTAATASVQAGTYTFQGGMFLQQDGNGRRLEISVSGIRPNLRRYGKHYKRLNRSRHKRDCKWAQC
jgi:hypothetical protein